MIRNTVFAISMLLCVAANAQTYEYSGTPKAGFHVASLEETCTVIREVTRLNNALRDIDSIRSFIDNPGSYVALASDQQLLLGLFDDLKIKPAIAGFYAIGHSEGTVVLRVGVTGSVLRFVSSDVPFKLYVKKIADEPDPQPKLDPKLLDLILSLLTPEQRLELLRKLQELEGQAAMSGVPGDNYLLNIEGKSQIQWGNGYIGGRADWK